MKFYMNENNNKKKILNKLCACNMNGSYHAHAMVGNIPAPR